MTSEVENVMRAQLVAKTKDLKQIAVSTTNLTPDANGIAPLEKQGAFTIEQAQAPVAETTVPPVQETVVPTPTVETPAPAVETVAPAVETPMAPEANTQTNELTAPINENDNLESIEYKKPSDDGILTAPAVDVVGATGLDQMNISAFVDKSIEGLNELVKEEPQQEQQVQKMEMPVMDQEIKAQEPVGQDERLFEGAQMDPTQMNQSIPPVGDTPFTIPTVDNNLNNNVDTTLTNPMNVEQTTSEVNTEFVSEPLTEVNNMVNETEVNPMTTESEVIEPTGEVMQDASQPIQSTTEVAQETTKVNTESLEASAPIEEMNQTEIPTMDAINNMTSAFDDHIKMPEDLAKELNLPTLDNSMETSEISTVEQPSAETTVPLEEMKPMETIDIENKLDPIFNRFKDELIFTIKSMNAAAMENTHVEETNITEDVKTDMAPVETEPVSDLEFPAPTEVNPDTLEFPEKKEAAAGFNDMENQFSDNMTIDDEPVHGKFI